MKEFIKRNKVVITLICVFSILLIGGTYALLTIELFGEKSNSIIVGTLELELDESTCTGINISNGIPVLDEVGMKEVACTFTLENTGEIDSNYTIYLDDASIEASEERMQDKFIKYSLIKNSVNTIDILTTTGSNPDRVIDNGILNVGESNSYELRLWIDSGATAEVMGTVALMKLRVVGEILDLSASGEESDRSGANVPELVVGMIPVIYDESVNEWVKAGRGNWYNYDEQKWANAVTVTETNRNTLVNSNPGTTIPMEDINTFMVWIPRYSYTIKDTYGYQGYGGDTPSISTPGAFDIKFIDSNIIDLGSAEYTGDTAENWFTNSAFCWGNSCDSEITRANAENRELSGIWISKFEVSNSGTDIPEIVPNVSSWRSVRLGTVHDSVKNNMNGINSESIYGLTEEEYDAHLIKNTEWGAVAYLSQSKYGKYGNINYLGVNKEIFGNNCSSYITGISSSTVNQSSVNTTCTTNTYDTIIGHNASTTGNISGIYDMSGGAYEYVMGNMKDYTDSFYPKDAVFSTSVSSKYYNAYDYHNVAEDSSRGMIGDATREVEGFYNDTHFFPWGTAPWFQRGGSHSSNVVSGIYSYNRASGDNDTNRSFRISIAKW